MFFVSLLYTPNYNNKNYYMRRFALVFCLVVYIIKPDKILKCNKIIIIIIKKAVVWLQYEKCSVFRFINGQRQ